MHQILKSSNSSFTTITIVIFNLENPSAAKMPIIASSKFPLTARGSNKPSLHFSASDGRTVQEEGDGSQINTGTKLRDNYGA